MNKVNFKPLIESRFITLMMECKATISDISLEDLGIEDTDQDLEFRPARIAKDDISTYYPSINGDSVNTILALKSGALGHIGIKETCEEIDAML